MLDFALKLTRTPESMLPADVAKLREAGMDDATISHVAQVTALFAYYNRVADGLGVELEAHWD